MATRLGYLQTCETPVKERRDDNGWLIEVQECGCSRTYGAYHGYGSRNLLHTDVCAAAVEVCPDCHQQTWPHSDCRCGE